MEDVYHFSNHHKFGTEIGNDANEENRANKPQFEIISQHYSIIKQLNLQNVWKLLWNLPCS
jgi:hypothetical protein